MGKHLQEQNLKTLNGQSLLGEGNVVIPTAAESRYTKDTLNITWGGAGNDYNGILHYTATSVETIAAFIYANGVPREINVITTTPNYQLNITDASGLGITVYQDDNTPITIAANTSQVIGLVGTYNLISKSSNNVFIKTLSSQGGGSAIIEDFSITEFQNGAAMNSLYPNANVGDEIYCFNIETMYKKISSIRWAVTLYSNSNIIE